MTILMAKMSSDKYRPGSLVRLLGTELPASRKETKLQAIFSQPAVQSRTQSVQQVPVCLSVNKHTSVSSDDDRKKKKRKHCELLRDASPHSSAVENWCHKKLRLMHSAPASTEASVNEQVFQQSVVSDGMTYVNRRALNAKNALQRIETKTNTVTSQSSSHDVATEARTVFVGNVSLGVRKKMLRRLFKGCGAIETVRIRSVPVADLKLPKKASVITKQFHPSRNTANCYIVFATEVAAENALSLNGTELEGLHIRVSPASIKPKHDHEKSVFIGNLPFDVEEEPLRQHFRLCGAITNVRIIRDQKTGAGKGFGYVTFADASSVTLALSLDNQLFSGRRLRVQRSTEKPKPTPRKNSSMSLKRHGTSKPARVTTTVDSAAESNNVAHKVSKMRDKKGRHQGPLTACHTETTTLMKHKRIKEHKKKKMKKRSEARRKQSLGRLLMKKNS